MCRGIHGGVLSLSTAWRWQREQAACQLHGYAPKNTDKIKHRQHCVLSYQVKLLHQLLCKGGQQGLFPFFQCIPKVGSKNTHKTASSALVKYLLASENSMGEPSTSGNTSVLRKLQTPDTRSPANTSRSSCMYSILWILLGWPTLQIRKERSRLTISLTHHTGTVSPTLGCLLTSSSPIGTDRRRDSCCQV